MKEGIFLHKWGIDVQKRVDFFKIYLCKRNFFRSFAPEILKEKTK